MEMSVTFASMSKNIYVNVLQAIHEKQKSRAVNIKTFLENDQSGIYKKRKIVNKVNK